MSTPTQIACQCGNVYPDIYRECPKCQGTAPLQAAEPPKVQRKYPAVSCIAMIIRAISVIAFIIGITMIFAGNPQDRVLGYSLAPIAVTSFLSASVITILIDIEKNTRKS